MANDASRTARAAGSLLSVPIYVGAAVLALGAAVYAYVHYASRPAANAPLTAEAKAYVRNLSLADVSMKAAENYFGQRVVEIEGKIGNQGERGVDSIEIFCVFYDGYGQLVLRKRVPIVGGRTGGLKPGEAKPFRLPFDEIPDSWNQAMPSLVIASVKFN